MTRSLAFLLLLASAVPAGPKRQPDEVNPRAPDSPLEIPFLDYYCPTCVLKELQPPVEGRSLADPKIKMMRGDAVKLAQHLGIGKPKDLGKKYFLIQTPDFKLMTNLKRTKVKPGDSRFIRYDLERLKQIFPKLTIGLQGTVLRPHQRAHLYHIRFTRVYAHFQALTGNKRKWLGMKAPYECYVFDEYAEHHTLCDEYTGKTQDKAGIQHHSRDLPNFMMFTTADRLVEGDDRKFANHCIHQFAHNLVDGFWNYHRETPAWLEEGIAHYYERRETPKDNTFCWTEGKAPRAFEKENWAKTILAMVRRQKDVPLGQWCEKLQPGELGGLEQGLCWSIVQWMIETDPIRFSKVLEESQDRETRPTQAEVLKRAFGAPPNVLHARWREWVLEEYSKKGRK